MYQEGTLVTFDQTQGRKPLSSGQENVYCFSLPSHKADEVNIDLDQFTCTIRHAVYHCPLYIWVSQAVYKSKLKNKVTHNICYVVYVEYRGADRGSRYCEKAFLSINEVRKYIEEDIDTITLAGINTDATSEFPVKGKLDMSRRDCT